MVLCLVLATWTLPGRAQTPEIYQAIDVAPFSRADFDGLPKINTYGHVAGTIPNLSAFVWENGTIRLLGVIGLATESEAHGINNSGEVVGVLDDEEGVGGVHAFLWSSGLMQDLGGFHGGGGAESINNTGVIVGWSHKRVEDPGNTVGSPRRAFLKAGPNGAIMDLGTLISGNPSQASSFATGINDVNEVVGWSHAINAANQGTIHAFVWREGLMTDLGALELGPFKSISIAYGINRLGQVVGWSDNHAVLWNRLGGIIDLGSSAWAYAINNRGQIVGTSNGRAVMWEGGSMTDLTDQVIQDPDARWVLEAGTDINDNGQIVGYGTLNGETRTFLLNPPRDHTAPTSTATLSEEPNAAGWHHHDVTVDITATDEDGGSGVKQITYEASGAKVITTRDSGGDATSFTIDVEGTTVANYFAVDNADNAESPHTLVVKIDKTAPVSTGTLSPAANADGWHKDLVKVFLNATETAGGSEVKAISYAAVGAEVIPLVDDGGDAASFVVDSEGETNISFRAIDNADNLEAPPHGLVVRFDRTAPASTATLLPSANPAGWHNAPVTVVVDATDNAGGSGLKQISYAATGAHTIPAVHATGNSASFVIDAEGTTTISSFAADNADNEEPPHSVIVKIDRTAPISTATITPAANAAGWYNTPVTALLNATDAAGGSDVKQITYAASGAQVIPAVNASGNSASFVINVDGTTTFSFFATDNADAMEPPQSRVVKLDQTPPALDVQNVSRPASGPLGTTVPVYPTRVSDNLDPAPTMTCTPAAPRLFPVGNTRVDCSALDVAGNISRQSFFVHVRGAAEQVAELAALIDSFNLRRSTDNKFSHHLDRALSRLQNGQTSGACGDLAALIDDAQKASGKKLGADEAAQIVAFATRIRAVLGC